MSREQTSQPMASGGGMEFYQCPEPEEVVHEA